MGLLINTEDFVGEHKITNDAGTTANLELCIEEHEETYLRKLLGSTLFDLFKANYDATAQTNSGQYLTIRNAFAYDYGDCLVESKGMKKMLLGFIYWEFTRLQPYHNTVAGMVKQKTELGDIVDGGINSRYNKAINTYEAIQTYIEQNLDDFPDYNGQPIESISWF